MVSNDPERSYLGGSCIVDFLEFRILKRSSTVAASGITPGEG